MASKINKKSSKVIEDLINEEECDNVEINLDETNTVEPLQEDVVLEKPVNNRVSKTYAIKVKSHTRIFIGEWFTFEPNKVYKVEAHIKAKLQQAGLLLPV